MYSQHTTLQQTAAIADTNATGKTASGQTASTTPAPKTYYIGTDGDNSNDGSRESPFASIDAIVDALKPGDTVYYLEGTYQNATYGRMVDDGSGNMIRDIWKQSNDTIIKLNDVHGTEDAPITISAEPGAHVLLQYDGNGAIVARQSSHIIFNGFEIEGPASFLTKEEAADAQYTYRIATSEDEAGNPIYEYYERDPYEVLETKISDIIDGYGETIDQSGSGKPLMFNAPAISLPKYTTHIEITNNVIHDSAAHAVSGHGGNDYITVTGNEVYGNNKYTSNGTHAISFKFLHSTDDSDDYKIIITDNHIYDNYNLLISWVTTKTAVKRHIDEGKSIHIQEAWDTADGSKYDWDHGRILIEGNIVERAGNSGITLNDVRGATVTNNVVIDGAFGNSLLALDTVEDSEYFGFFSAQGLEEGAAIAAGGLRITNSIDNKVTNNYFSFSDDGAFAVDASAGTVAGSTTFLNNLYFGGAGERIRSEPDDEGALHDGFIETPGNFISGLNGADTLQGTSQTDFIIGLNGSDIINGGDGDDTINGGDGNDYLRGDGGDDTLDGGFGADWLRGGAGADVLNGWAGTDWADYISSSAAVTVNLLTNTATGGDAEGDTFLYIERVYGSTHDDHITGDNGVNYLRGWSGDDQLFGGAGNDYLQGGAGADTLDGGDGTNDWAYYVSSTIGLTINLGDTSLNTGEAIGDVYINIENIVGSRHDDDITGDSANNFLRGLQGDDSLQGGDGNDFLRGDQGADVHDGGAGVDWAYYANNSAAVTIDLAANTASGGEATGDSFISIERVYGSRFADTITGDSGANYLRGSFGNDTIIGSDGDDFLQGDSGADVLDGGNGSDWAYYFSSGSTGGITINLGDTSQNTGEAIGDSYISIENVVGSRFNDIIIGDYGDNYLRGAQGDDIINGGAGNDILRGEAGADTFVFESGTGSDTVIDYDDSEDMIDLTDFGFADVNDALSNAAEVNGDVVFTLGTDVITIEDTTVSEISDNLIV